MRSSCRIWHNRRQILYESCGLHDAHDRMPLGLRRECQGSWSAVQAGGKCACQLGASKRTQLKACDQSDCFWALLLSLRQLGTHQVSSFGLIKYVRYLAGSGAIPQKKAMRVTSR